MTTAPNELGKRIKFQNFGKSNYRSREVSEAMNALDMVNIIRLIYPTTSLKPPMQADFKKSPKLQFLDTGIVNYASGIQADLIGSKDLLDELPRSSSRTHGLTGSDRFKYILRKKPRFWVREKTQSSAEIDLVLSFQQLMIPIEVKSGNSGSLKSLHQFIDMCEHGFAIRLFAGELSIEEAKTPKGKKYKLLNLPYYLASKLPEYIEWFVSSK